MKMNPTPRSVLPTLLGAALLMSPAAVRATIVGPYTVDGNTLHLWHMDASVVPVPDAVSSGGTNLINLQGGSTLGNGSYTGFGSALNTVGSGQDSTANRAPLLAASAGSPPANVTTTLANTSGGAFTFEAVVWIGFDPTKNFGTTANGGNNRATPFNILTGESSTTANRIFQFRIFGNGNVGTAPNLNTSPLLTFENIRAGTASQGTIWCLIPTNGPDAIVSNQWYHVAVTYNGSPSTVDNIKFYWTLMDPSRTAANKLTIGSATTTLTGLNPIATVTTPFMVGNDGRNRNSNFIGLTDEVRISNKERTAVEMMFTATTISIITQPQSQLVAAGDSPTLTVVATGESPRYQWQFYNTNVPSATNASLTLANITTAQAGPYQVVITNSTSSKTSDVAMIRVGAVTPETYNTGVDASRALLPGAAVDPHYALIHSDDPAYPGPTAYVDSAPIATWLVNGPNSKWISPAANGSAIGGVYTYRTTVLLDTLDPANTQVTGGWAIDNAGLDILLNGVSLGLTSPGFTSLASFTITNNFVPGLNTLDFVTTNFPGGGNNPTAFRAEIRGVGLPLPSTAPSFTQSPVNVTTQVQQTAVFQSVAVGSGPLSFQWYHGATLLAGQTNRTLTLANLTTGDAGTYTVYVTNTVTTANASAVLTVITPPVLAWLGIDLSNPSFWDTVTTNWLDTGSLANVAFAASDDVIFDSRGSATPAVSVVEALSPNSITVDATTDYTISGSGAITGAVVVTKLNSGKLTVDLANNYSGVTRILGGTLQVGNGDAAGSLGTSSVSNNAALVFNRTDTFTAPNSISGTGSVTQAGSGVLLLAGNNNYTGPTVVSSGTLNVNGPNALGTTDSGTTVANGAQLYLDGNLNIGAEPVTLNGYGFASPLEGALHKAAGGGTIFGGPIILASDSGIKADTAATWTLTNAAGIQGTNVSLSVQCDGTAATTVSGPISLGTGAYVQYGPGSWTLLASNNWSGGTTINAGTLNIGNGGGGATIGNGSIANSGTLTFNLTNNYVLTGGLSGSGALNQNGSGMLTLASPNTYSGTTTVRGAGVLRVSDSGALGSGQCTIGTAQTDTCRLEVLNNITLNNTIAIFPRVWFQTPPPDPVVAPDIVNVSGTNTLSPPTSITIGGGGNLLTLQADSGKLILTAGITAGGVGRHLALRGAAFGEVVGNIDHTGANSQFVWKLDSGTWTLDGAMSPGAATTISNGVLILNGSLDNVLTNAGGTLGGTGILSGPVYINAGATLSPGASIGTMTISNSLTLRTGSITSMEIDKTSSACDQVTGLTSVTYGGTLVLNNLSGTLAPGDTFKLFSAATYSGSFSGISPASPGAGLIWGTNTMAIDGTLRIQPAVAAPPVIKSEFFDGSNLVLDGSNGPVNGGYAVVASTNVAAPLSNWSVTAFGAFDAAGAFNATNVINPAIPRTFFRLRVP